MKRMLVLLMCLCLTLPALAEDVPANSVWVGSQQVMDYVREIPIDMPAQEDYMPLAWGVTTWRGGSFRQNAAVGTLDAAPTGLELAWTAETGALHLGANEQFWGFSWYSQPVIAHWAVEVRQSMLGLTDEAWETQGLREVIFPSLDGRIYFLNLTDGAFTRDAIDVGYPLMGAVTVHPMGYPLMLAGQYSDMLRYGAGSIGAHWYELLTQRSIRFVDGNMEALGVTDAYNGAFNTSALIDRNTNTAVALSKDGYLYTAALDLRLYASGHGNDLSGFQVNFAPAVIAKVTRDGEEVTTAPAMNGNLLWFATNEGRLRCIDTTTMQTLWTAELTGPIYATPALERTEDGLALYISTQDAVLCMDAETGDVRWQQPVYNFGGYPGTTASPVVGENALAGLVVFTVNGYMDETGEGSAAMMALDKQTGEVVWSQEMGSCYASPVAVYDESGNGWLIQAESYGTLHLLDGLNGTMLDSLELGGFRISSPAAYGDMLVIGGTVHQGGRVYGVRIKEEEERK